jgi:hypothetical protein
VVVGGAVTAGLLGVTIWSGLDTMAYRDTFDKNRTQANLERGNAKQLRTNVLIGATAGVAVLTTVAAIWFVNWKGNGPANAANVSGRPSVRAGLGAGSLLVTGTF